jgi:phenylpropionate dioxygenase-like ring-hydroxylating dioxygenase large terminal subunit
MHSAEHFVQVRWPASFNEIPKEVFQREDVYRRELERIFYGPEWHPIAHRAEIAKPGDFKTTYVGEAPVLVVHGDDGELRVFANSCPHRGTTLESCARGHAKTFECPYHRWTFKNTGRLIGVPGAGDFPPAFRKEDYGLRQLRSGAFCGLIFASFSADAPNLDDYIDEAKDYLADSMCGDGRLKLLGYQKVRFDSNWKEYSDNDGYHGPLLHAAFRHLEMGSAKGVRFVTRHNHKVSKSELKNVPNNGFLHDHSLVEGRDRRAPPQNNVIVLFPMNIITKNLDVISIRYAFPRSVHETEVHYAYFAHEDDDAELFRHRVRQASNLIGPSGLISLEDGAVFNRVHVGSHTAGTIAFQKGVKGPITPPCTFERSDEAANLIRWEHYRQTMGFSRD